MERIMIMMKMTGRCCGKDHDHDGNDWEMLWKVYLTVSGYKVVQALSELKTEKALQMFH